MLTVTSMEAQNRFGKLLDTVQREPVVITRHGRTAAFMVSAKDMQLLQDLKRQNAVTAFEAWSQAAAATTLPAAAELTDDAVVRMLTSSPP